MIPTHYPAKNRLHHSSLGRLESNSGAIHHYRSSFFLARLSLACWIVPSKSDILNFTILYHKIRPATENFAVAEFVRREAVSGLSLLPDARYEHPYIRRAARNLTKRTTKYQLTEFYVTKNFVTCSNRRSRQNQLCVAPL